MNGSKLGSSGNFSKTINGFTLGDSITFKVNVSNDGADDSPALANSIAFSFPAFQGSADTARVAKAGGTSSDLNYEDYVDQTVGGGDKYPEYLMVEASDTNGWDGTDWGLSEKNSFEVSIIPKAYGTFDIYYRAAMATGADWTGVIAERPSSGYLDCLGIRAYRVRLTLPAPDIEGPYSPGGLDMNSSSDSGYSDSDRLTKNQKPRFDWNEPNDRGGSAIAQYQWEVRTSSGSLIDDGLTTSKYDTPDSNLSDGNYKFRVQAKDAPGNWGDWSGYVYFTVDNVDPSVPSLSSPSNNARTTDRTPNFDWSNSTENGSGIYRYELLVETDALGYDRINEEIASSYYNTLSSQALDAGGDGYDWRVRVEDKAGNQSAWTSNRRFYVDDLFGVDLVVVELNKSSATTDENYIRSGTITGTGNGTVTYRWEHKEPGGVWVSDIFDKTTTMSNGSATISAGLYDVPFPGGQHWFRVVVSSPNSKTSNEVSLSVTVPLPDLQVTALSVSLASIQAGEQVNVGSTVKNLGQGGAFGSYVGFYLSPNSSWDSGDTFLGHAYTGSLAADAEKDHDISFTIPAETESGSYYVIAFADYENSESRETYEGNNTRSAALSIFRFEVDSVAVQLNKSNATVDDTYTRSGTITGTGDGTISYRWEHKEPGGDWVADIFEKTATMSNGSATISPSQLDAPYPNGTHQFRVVTAAPNSGTSNTASLVVTEESQILAAYGRGLKIGQAGTVKFDIHAGSDGNYYVKVFNKGAVPPLKWDWSNAESNARTLIAGADSSFSLTTTPDSGLENFEVWLYRQTLIPGVFTVVDKYSFRLATGMKPSMEFGDFYFTPGHPSAAKEILLDGRVPIVLVHGQGSDRRPQTQNYWKWWLDHFASAPQKDLFKIYRFVYDSKKSIDENGAELATFLTQYEELDGKKVIFLAHSMGGLVCRYAMNSNPEVLNRTAKLVTLATPHLGSPGANAPWLGYCLDSYGSAPLSLISLGGIYSKLSGTGGEADLSWHDTQEIPTDVFNLVGTYASWPYNFNSLLLNEGLSSPFTGSETMRSHVSDDKVIAFGGTNGISGAGGPADGHVETAKDHSGLQKAFGLMALVYKRDNSHFTKNDGLVPLESALFSTHLTLGTQAFNLSDEFNKNLDHSSFLDDGEVIVRVGTVLRAIASEVNEAETAVIALTGNMNFGNVEINTSKISNLTISNSGDSVLQITSINYPTGFTGSMDGVNISAGQSVVIPVTFSPTETQPYSGTITVNSDKTSGINTIDVSGVGALPTIGVLTYQISGNSVVITDCETAATGVVYIPSMIEGKPVTSIGTEAFANCDQITGVTIPDSVTTIGARVFWHCYELSQIVIPEGVTTMGERAFVACYKLESVSLPNSLTTIEDYAFFYDCRELSNVNLPVGLEGIGAFMFYGCSSLEQITLEASITSIGNYAFYNCSLLNRVEFKGDAPSVGTGIFGGAAQDFSVYYRASSNGFTSPIWQGYPAEAIQHDFDTAVADAGLFGGDAAPSAKPFNDGVSNLLKYAFNMDLSKADSKTMSQGGTSGLPMIYTSGIGEQKVLKVEYLRRKDSDLLYSLELSSNMTGFAEFVDASYFTETSIDNDWERIVYEVDYNSVISGGSLFARVRVVMGSDEEVTVPVGVEPHDLAKGFNMIGLRLHQPILLTGVFGSPSGTTLPTDIQNLSVALGASDLSGRVLIEVIEGDYAGIIIEADTWTASSFTGLEELSSSLAGDRFQVRRASTLSDVFGSNNSAGILEGDIETADVVWVSIGGGSFDRFYYSPEDPNAFPLPVTEGWKDSLGRDASEATITYLDGIFIEKKVTGPLTVGVVGSVKTYPVSLYMLGGGSFNAYSGIFPGGTTLQDSKLQDVLLHGGLEDGDVVWMPNGPGGWGKFTYQNADPNAFPLPVTEGWKNSLGADAGDQEITSGFYIQRKASNVDVLFEPNDFYRNLR